MIGQILSALVVTAVLGASGAGKAPRGQTGFYCDMSALSAKERSELPQVLERLIARQPKVTELQDGFELHFAKGKGLYALAAQWTSAESRCCPFFDLSISVQRFNGPMTVRITGPKGVKEFINADLPKLRELMHSK